MADFSKELRLFPCFPCVLVTVSDNIITIGMVHIFSFNPPLIGIGVSPHRHSFHLIKKAKEFVVNVPARQLLTAVTYCGEHSGRDGDKYRATGLTREPAVRLSTPAIKECPVKFECRLVQEVEAGDHSWFIGEIVAVTADPHFRREDAILYWGGFYRLPGTVIGQRG